MSDLNDEVHAISEHLRRLNIDFDRYASLTAQSADAIRRKTAAEQYRDAQLEKSGLAAAQSLQGLGRAVGSAAGAMYEGRRGASAFNDSIANMNVAIRQAAIALTVLAPGGTVGKIITGGLTAIGLAAYENVQEMQKMGREMLDTSYDSYSKLSAAGASTSKGLQGVAESAAKTGVNLLKMDQYINLVSSNSDNLALFGKTVFEGRKKFDDLGASLAGERQKIFALGMTQDDMNESMMGFIRLQTLSGNARKMSDNELTMGTKKYIYEQDELTKLLGMSRKDQQATREAALSEQRFGAKIAAMRASGDERQIAAADELEKENLMLAKRFPELAQGFRDLTTGMMTTEAAQKANMTTQGKIMTDIQAVSSGMKSGGEAAYSTLEAVAKGGEKFNMAYQMGTGESFLLKFKETSEARAYLERDFNEDLKRIKLERDKTTGGAPGGDALLADYAKLLKDQQTAMTNLQLALAKGFTIGPLDLGMKAAMADVDKTVAKAVTDAINRYFAAFGHAPPPEAAPVGTQEKKTAKTPELDVAQADYQESDKKRLAAQAELLLRNNEEKRLKTQGGSTQEIEANARKQQNAIEEYAAAVRKTNLAYEVFLKAKAKVEEDARKGTTPVKENEKEKVVAPPPPGESEKDRKAREGREAEIKAKEEKAAAETAKKAAEEKAAAETAKKAAEEKAKKDAEDKSKAKETANITVLDNGARVLDDVLELVKQGVPVISNVRTQKEQEALVDHTDDKGNRFTKENLPVAENSKHLTGDALDVRVKDMTKDLEKILKDNGWMRPLPKSDPGHWQRVPNPKEKKTSDAEIKNVDLATVLSNGIDMADTAAGLTINSEVATLNSKGMNVSLDSSSDVAKLIMEPVMDQMASSQKDQSAARSNFENSIGDLRADMAKQKTTDELLLAAVQELIRIQKNGVSVNEKILAAQA